jgi:hypothetical protein
LPFDRDRSGWRHFAVLLAARLAVMTFITPTHETYTINTENSITAYGSQQVDFEAQTFASQQELDDRSVDD